MHLTVIITGSQPSMWYKAHIGKPFEVTDVPTQSYYQYKGQKIIFKSDCRIFEITGIDLQKSKTQRDYKYITYGL